MNLSRLLNLSRIKKRLIFITVDCALIPLSLYLAFALRYGEPDPWAYMTKSWILFPVLTAVGCMLILGLLLDRIKLDAFDIRSIARIGLAAILLAISAIVLSYVFQLPAPRSVPFLFGVLFFLASAGIRLTGMVLLQWLLKRDGVRKPVAIYGAGAAGVQLASALRQSREAHPIFFVDDKTSLQKLTIAGLPVYNPNKIENLIEKHKIEQILLAVPSMGNARRNEIISKLKNYDIEVQVLPSFIELMAGKGLNGNLRTVSPDELLGRNKVALDTPEISKTYAGRVVMVTGAGGSIGSELCRQLLNCNPARIILFEHGEFQLYSINQELQVEAKAMGIPIIPRLGSVTNKPRVEGVISQENVEIILHAAAYKHVPLVEENELEGARNNTLGTQIVAEAASAAEIERFILISTDKAVRPTNIMGATKRMAELVVQDVQTRSKTTKFSMVRFGNVLGSSGSVLPLFQKQISRGGPVTVTHKEVTRFFMTIPEAARLVLLAGAYATGGDVFVLDMGKPQKIIDIAHQMIRLSGFNVYDPETGEGDIAIEVTGLRPGEKLYEELLIDDDSLLGTPHSKILRAQEAMLSQIEVAAMIKEIQASITQGDTKRLRHLVKARVDGYHVPPKDQQVELKPTV